MADEPETTTEETTSEQPDTGKEVDWQQEAAKWKAQSRKHEDRAKAHADAAKRLAEIEEAQKTAEQKAADKAAEAEAKAARAAREAALLRIALRKGLTEAQAKRLQGETEEELEADADELLSWAKRDEASDDKTDGTSGRPKEKMKSGATRDADGPPQLTREDLKKMTPEEIVKADEEGRLKTLKGA